VRVTVVSVVMLYMHKVCRGCLFEMENWPRSGDESSQMSVVRCIISGCICGPRGGMGAILRGSKKPAPSTVVNSEVANMYEISYQIVGEDVFTTAYDPLPRLATLFLFP